MSIRISFEGKMRSQIFVMNNPVGNRQSLLQEIGQVVIADSGGAECVKLFNFAEFQLKLQGGQCSHRSSQAVANAQDLCIRIHSQQLSRCGKNFTLNGSVGFQESKVNLALFAFIIRDQQKADVFKIVGYIDGAPVSVYNCFSLFLIANESHDLSSGILDIGHIFEFGDIGAKFTCPGLNFLPRAVSDGSIISIGDGLFPAISTTGIVHQNHKEDKDKVGPNFHSQNKQIYWL